jgi:hypothetical protein
MFLWWCTIKCSDACTNTNTLKMSNSSRCDESHCNVQQNVNIWLAMMNASADCWCTIAITKRDHNHLVDDCNHYLLIAMKVVTKTHTRGRVSDSQQAQQLTRSAFGFWKQVAICYSTTFWTKWHIVQYSECQDMEKGEHSTIWSMLCTSQYHTISQLTNFCL